MLTILWCGVLGVVAATLTSDALWGSHGAIAHSSIPGAVAWGIAGAVVGCALGAIIYGASRLR